MLKEKNDSLKCIESNVKAMKVRNEIYSHWERYPAILYLKTKDFH